MFGLYVSVPIACFRKGLAREFLESEILPPPSTCYGFLLSLVGETDRRRHVGARVTAGLLNTTELSVVLRTVWRVKSKPLGSSGNTRPDFQQLLSGIELAVWLDSSDEPGTVTLESRVREAVVEKRFDAISRFGGLSLGESTHLVNDVLPLDEKYTNCGRTFLLSPRGRMSLPVWVDHVGSAGTRYSTGDVEECPSGPPTVDRVPRIEPPE